MSRTEARTRAAATRFFMAVKMNNQVKATYLWMLGGPRIFVEEEIEFIKVYRTIHMQDSDNLIIPDDTKGPIFTTLWGVTQDE